MESPDILDGLNAEQREAVSIEPGRVLILAGAGSGKTRVLTRRAAWLVRRVGASPFDLLAVTFTNKAAGEMRGRIGHLLGITTTGIWVGTFHGIAHRLLRMHSEEAGLPQAFQILDADDQLRLVKRVMRARGSDERRFPPRQVRAYIAGCKEEGLRPPDLSEPETDYQAEMLAAYRDYEEACRRGGLVDFAELLLRSYELLGENTGLLDHYRRRFQHLLVDEFQDTNALQYLWLKRLAGDGQEVFVVGDDDQSIYGWRGAQVENLERFRKEMGDVRVLRLEQNYRSTATILNAANGLIAHNTGRMGKELWTSGDRGEPLVVYAAFNETDEARWVVERIRQHLSEGNYARGDFGVLYRSNAQSRALEEALIAQRLPYRVYGGLRFFERAEIKDALAYLRLTINRHDDAAFERVVNTPPRGIGDRTVEALREAARGAGVSLGAAARELIAGTQLAGRARKAVAAFLEQLDALEAEVAGRPLDEQVERTIARTGLRAYHQQDGERGESRLENLDELVTAARLFEQYGEHAEGMDRLTAFLSHAALEAGEGQADDGTPAVQLMTLHSAKGLEFPVVFLVGLEEGLFPHRMSIEEPGRLEEERRLCYVGLTRARERAYLTWAESRRVHGVQQVGSPSRFLRELPVEHLDEVRPRFTVRRTGESTRPLPPRGVAGEAAPGIGLGARVAHDTFGQGVVMACEGSGANARVQVRFDDAGTKWLVANLAGLEPVVE